jgi:alanine-synthesizing transaminase
VVGPRGAHYCFPRIDTRRCNITDDEQFIMDLLQDQHILLVHGTGFNWPEPDHFRIVFLPDKETLTDALGRLGKFLESYRQA